MAKVDAIEIRQQTTGDGAILFDNACVRQAGAFEADWFEPGYWSGRGLATTESAGRGSVTYAQTAHGNWVLRHYRRGGMVARVMGDRYLWSGAQQTRSFAEFRLLAELARRGLHVPRPVAARYRRIGVHYRADLITLQIADAQTLAQRLVREPLDARVAQDVGTAIARLHAVGADHADLNAHNVLLDPSTVWVVDFDRGELRAPQRAWQLANLARLKRSLLKLGAAPDGEAAFERRIWQPLMVAYEHGLDHAATKTAGAH
ncbi:MAG TPA: 3-deoxy-D-manno-octulosonic acid kinase [Rudaea sp.]|jgi:3-deoxy-D-manno-octulosonic acid kinase|uniref:3-deoxy-D-manno-octulosonic acid kinase n=1 Tax=Rudaea sp. TaxID=2136325 RepID=UPI002F946208